MNNINWDLLHSFFVVAKHGSLSAAGKAEHMAQPTISRHIAKLEEKLGYRLFDRSRNGVSMTKRGTDLFEHVQKMAEVASAFEKTQTGKSERLSGTVRLTASRILSTYALPDILTRFHHEEPEIAIELVASDLTENLLLREADIALRMFRPTQQDVITRKLSELQMGAYASYDYIQRRGEPAAIEDVLHHDVIGYDRNTLIIDGFRRSGFEVDRDFFAFRSDDQVVCWEMVIAGYGIGFNQLNIGDADPRVKRIEWVNDIVSLPLWLTAHSSLNTNSRIRRVYDYLAAAFTHSA